MEESRWDIDGPLGYGGESKMAERCAPDWENMIKREKAKLQAIEEFYDAVDKFIFSPHSHVLNRSKLSDLHGTLHFKHSECQYQIHYMIDEQEKSSK